MRRLSEKLARYVITADVVSEELYAVYQYGFQIGLEMLLCFAVCLSISIYLHMVLEFIIFTVFFMLLRIYAGGVHLNSFSACFLCSVAVQTGALLISNRYKFSITVVWIIILAMFIFIWKLAPVESGNRELDKEEKAHCKKVTRKIIIGMLVFTVFCTVYNMVEMVSLVALTVLIVFISQCIGIVKYRVGKRFMEK